MSRIGQLKLLLITVRPKQWVKNFFIFAALIFSLHFLEWPLVFKTLITFALFCILASSIYIVNDIADLKEDRIHPEKKKRPLASGDLKLSYAYIAAVSLPLASIGLSFLVTQRLGYLFLAYFILFLAYSLKLKHIVILDVFFIGIGFVLRVLVGAVAISVPVSHWILVCTMFLALFLGFCKRRNELVILNENSSSHRKSLSEYSPHFLDQMVSITTASIIISYTLYTTSEETVAKLGTDRLIYTVPFVLYGIFRYLYLVHQKNKGGNPTEIALTDKPLVITIVFWAISIVLILYWGK